MEQTTKQKLLSTEQTLLSIEQKLLSTEQTLLSIEQKLLLIRSIGEEIVGDASLERLITYKPYPIAYDGFEPSSLDKGMHIAQGLLRAHNVNKFVRAGIKFKFWVADWFALMNLKLGGDLKKIQQAGRDMIDSWKACGMDLETTDSEGNPMVQFIWSSEEIVKRSDEYWRLVLDIATKFPLNRIKKCTQIMGRKEENNAELLLELNDEINKLFLDIETNNSFDNNLINKKEHIMNLLKKLTESNPQELAASQIFYPVMQCADVFFLNCDITSLGMDQRKVNMLALEYCDKIKRKLKPIIISHHMLMGLDGSDKMSKSNPDNTIFMNDSATEVKRKINRAFCEPGNIVKNPLIDWIQHLILELSGSITIVTKNEGLDVTDKNESLDVTDKNESSDVTDKNVNNNLVQNLTYTDINQIKNNFQNNLIHPKDLKVAVIESLCNLLLPVQERLKDIKVKK
jgi:tyrosyl-tRNA synthetase